MMQDQVFVGGGGENYGEKQGLLLKYANRHGLVAGATGTGKSVTLQILAEGFSKAGVPVFLSDVKGDLSGLGVLVRIVAALRGGAGRLLRIGLLAPREHGDEIGLTVRHEHVVVARHGDVGRGGQRGYIKSRRVEGVEEHAVGGVPAHPPVARQREQLAIAGDGQGLSRVG